MKRPVLLAVAEGAAGYAALVGALAQAGERVGWLDLRSPAADPSPALEEAAAAGALRAVAVAGGRVTTVKPIRGEAVLDDLLREHFRGCRLVLVRGGEGLVRLEAVADGWRLVPPHREAVRQSTSELLAGLRRPSFWRRLGWRAGV
ncbi:MAG: hypothetical protein ACE5EG_08845 [Thermoanaerobaculia bacterium]